MHAVEPVEIQCPYCGEIIETCIDCSVPQQSYIEDCQVCCRPIEFDVHIDNDGFPYVSVSRDDD